jgi:hypothetical protein
MVVSAVPVRTFATKDAPMFASNALCRRVHDRSNASEGRRDAGAFGIKDTFQESLFGTPIDGFVSEGQTPLNCSDF